MELILMEMKQTNFNQKNDWEDKRQVKKGNLGERIVKGYLENKGWIVYGTETSGKHPFDKLCVKDKKSIIVAEIKTKARMNNYPATGFNEEHYLEYQYIYKKYKIEIFIFFVDEKMKQIYGNKLSELEQKYTDSKSKEVYPLKIRMYDGKYVILFPLKKMKKIKNLSNEEVEELKLLSTRNYDYDFKGQ